MAVYEALLLNTVVPQIQAAQAGDSYVMVVNATTPALRITQTGTGNAISVEDEANPDATPFVVTAAGDVGIGTSSPANPLNIVKDNTAFRGQLSLQTVSASNFAQITFYDQTTLSGQIYQGYGTDKAINIANPLPHGIAFWTTNTERMRLDSSGNLGLGVTPSGWGGAKAFEAGLVGNYFIGSTAASYTSIGTASYYNGSNWVYARSTAASKYELLNDTHAWFTAPSGTANTTTITNGVSYTIITSGNQTAFGAANNNVGTSFTATSSGTLSSGTVSQNISFTQAMTLDASGRLLIGLTSNLASGAVQALINGTGTSYLSNPAVFSALSNVAGREIPMIYAFDSSNSGLISFLSGNMAFFTQSIERARISSDGTFRVKGAGTAGSTDAFQVAGTAPADAARIDSSGNVRIGVSAVLYSAERLSVFKSGNSESAAFVNDAGANNYTVAMSNRATTGDNKFVVFATESSDTTRGSIVYNRGTGLVTYATTSDYRAKDIIGPVANSGATIDALKVYNGKMKGATVERPMLIAHEAQEFAPYAVVGEKDAVSENGDPVFQQMDVSSLVPLLIAEIQSLRARVAQLEAK